MMKILQINSFFSVGGPPRIMMEYMTYLNERELNVKLQLLEKNSMMLLIQFK